MIYLVKFKAGILAAHGQYREALAILENIINIDPTVAEIYVNRGKALHHLGQYRAALSSFDRALKLKPTFAQAYSGKAGSLRMLKRLKEAIWCCEQALRFNALDAQALYRSTEYGQFN